MIMKNVFNHLTIKTKKNKDTQVKKNIENKSNVIQ